MVRQSNNKKPEPKPSQVAAFKWKTETFYLPEVVITSELRRVADEHLKAQQANPKNEEAEVAENEWNPCWDEKDEHDLFGPSKDLEVESKAKAETGLTGQESPTSVKRKEEAAPKPVPEATTKSTDEVLADLAKEEKQNSAATDLLKQKFNNRKELFKNLMGSASGSGNQPLKKCRKCNEDYADEDIHRKVCCKEGKFSLETSQSSFRTFDIRPKPAELKCLDCGKTFQKKIHLTLHQKIHASMDKPVQKPVTRSLKCNFCDRSFERNDDLQSHYQRQHNISNNLHVHQLNTGNKNLPVSNTKNVRFSGDEFHCEKCGRKFNTSNQVNIHVRLCKANAKQQRERKVESELQSILNGDSVWNSMAATTVAQPGPDEPEFDNSDDDSPNLIILNTQSVNDMSQENLPPASPTMSQNDNSSAKESNMPYECSHCARRFRFRYHLDFHEMAHYQTCASCKKRFPDNEYSVHSEACSSNNFQKEILKDERQSTCEKCGITFNSEFLLRRHLLVHSFGLETFTDSESNEFQDNLPFVCPSGKCTSRFSHQSDRDLHVEEKHSSENFGRCKECGRIFCSVFNLMRHRSSVHNLDHLFGTKNKDAKMFAMQMQPSYYYIQPGFHHTKPPEPYIRITDEDKLGGDEALERMTSHSLDSSSPSPTTLPLKETRQEIFKKKMEKCGLSMFTGRSKRRKLRREDVPIQSIYTCETCNKTFTQSQRMLYLVHLAEHRYPCQMCHLSFRTEILLQQHIERHNDPLYVPGRHHRFRADIPIQDSYTCETCGKSFAKSERTPYLIHLTEHKYTCHLCDNRSFKSKTLLTKHIQLHSDPNYVPGKRGRIRSDVPIQNEYTCKTCNKTYDGSERTLYILHLSEHKYKCHLCHVKCQSEKLLQLHIKRHDDPSYVPGQPGRFRSDVPIQDSYSCETCGKSFTKSERTLYIIHIDEHKYPCHLCDRSYRTDAFLQQHLKRHDDDDPSYVYIPGQQGRFRKDVPIQESYTCETCNKTFTKSERTLYIIHIDEHKYTCQLCDRGWRTEALLQQHLKRHEDPSYVPRKYGNFRADVPLQDIYTCETCGKTFDKSERTSYLLHIDDHKYPCHLCDQSYKSEILLQQHVKRHDDPNYVPGKRGRVRADIPIQNTYTCETCNKTYTKSERTLFLVHLSQHKREEKFKCPLCSRKHLSDKLLQQHLKRHDDPRYEPGRRLRTDIPFQSEYTCETCDRKFDDRTLYIGHLYQHKVKDHLTCKFCNQRFTTKVDYQDHMQQHDDPSYQPEWNETAGPGRPRTRVDVPDQENYTCKFCQRMFNERRNYMIHLSSHERGKRFTCQLCSLQFQSNFALEQHTKRHEDPSYVPRKRDRTSHPRIPIQDIYTCEICHKQYSKRSTFTVHMYQHRVREKFGCHLCERKFTSTAQLQQHLRKHLDPAFRARHGWKGNRRIKRTDIPYQEVYHCEHCGGRKSFTNRIKYLLHLRNHFLEENFACPYCPRRFKVKGSLKLHIETHNKVKAYECKDCLKKFRTKNCLYLHSQKFCKKIPCKYQCSLCDDRFHTTLLLQKHFSRSHTDNRKKSESEGSIHPEAELPCPHCKQTFNTTFGLTRHLCVYHPTSEAAIKARSTLLGLLRNDTNGVNQDGHQALETDSGLTPEDLEQSMKTLATDKESAENEEDQNGDNEDEDDNGYDISDMLATDFCETEISDPGPPSAPPTLAKLAMSTRAAPPKRTYSRNVCFCGKFMKYKSQKICHSRRCPCIQANKQCGKRCKCTDESCMNSRHREEEQQQIFKEGRENMIQEEQARRASIDSKNSFDDEELEDELPVPVESAPSAPIIVGQFSNSVGNQPSTSKGYPNVMMSSEFISLDDDEDADFANEADDVDPLADTDPLQASEPPPEEVATNKDFGLRPAMTMASSTFVTNSATASVPYGVRTSEPRLPIVSSSSTIPTTPVSFQTLIEKTITVSLAARTAELFSSTATSSVTTLAAGVAGISIPNPTASLDNFAQSTGLRCQFCKKNFKTMPSFISHFLVHGGDFGTFTCPLCTKEFTFLSDFITHLDLHNRANLVQCTKCSSRFITQKEMDKHLLVHHFKPMECGLCSEKFASASVMMMHWSKLHPTCQCGLCNVKFFSYDDLTFHMKSLHSPYDCIHCGARFEKVMPLVDHFLEKHYIYMHGKRTQPVAPTPTPTATNPPPPARAREMHNFKCDCCGLGFSDYEELNDHLAVHLSQGQSERPNNLRCDKCGKQFSDAEPLHDHLAQHIMGTIPLGQPTRPARSTSRTPELSNAFSASIGDPNSSRVYMRFSTGGSEITEQQESTQPERINDNLNAVEVFTCPRCYKTFNSKYVWMAHLRLYDSPLCSACGSMFDSRDELLRHLQNEDGNNRRICVVYDCRLCFQNFTHSKYLTSHLKKHERERAAAESASSDSVPIIVASTSLAPPKQQETSPNFYQVYVAAPQARSQQQPQDIEEITLE